MKAIYQFFIWLAASALIAGCTSDQNGENGDPNAGPLTKQVRVQVAHDATNVAFRFTWKTQQKTMPAGQANVGRNYPMHYHDMLKHNGTRFDRLPEGARMEEDRITFMIDKVAGGIPNFEKTGCAITCHTGMTDHHLLTDNKLDHWHWRGGRSGPMGYAEDVAVDNVSRIRDGLGTPPSKFIRSGGDRFREDQAALTGTAHPVLVDGLPRFVFNKGKNLGGYTIPSFFLTNKDNVILSNPYTQIPEVKELDVNRSLLVVYQDGAFDPVDKVNSIDLGYLVYVATGEVSHLPSHLRVEDAPETVFWKNYWSQQLGAPNAAAALAKLDAVHAEWSANQSAMVTRSVGFIYNSDQHDITSDRDYDPATNTWVVTLYRKLSTGSALDADLSTLPGGAQFAVSFAMHDVGGGSETHDISMPLILAKDPTADIRAASVADVKTANWETVPVHDTYWVKHSYVEQEKWTWDWLKGGAHPGGGMVGTTTCVSCHQDGLLTNAVKP